MTSEWDQRVAAARVLRLAWDGQALDWGRRDCGRLAAASLRAMGVNARLTRFGRYSSERGARRAMLKADRRYTDMPPILDDLGLARIGHAKAWPCDIIAFPGQDEGREGGWMGLGVHLGGRNLLAFAEDGVCRVGWPVREREAGLIAWRVPCLKR